MKRFWIYTLLLTLTFTACNPPEPVPSDSLSILSGVNDNKLVLGGAKGSQATFAISSKLAWEMLDTPGVEYAPAAGEATTKTSITATATEANYTLQQRKLGDVVIRLSQTRFTGIVAYQQPQIIVDEQYLEQITVAAVQGEPTTFTFECRSDDFEVVTTGDILCSIPRSVGTNKYSVAVSATKDNTTTEKSTIGHISFKVGGDTIEGRIEVLQQAAIAFDRSRIVINGTEGTTTSVDVITPFDFTVTSSATTLTAVRGEGQSIELTALEGNKTDAERKIAVLTVALVDYPSCSTTIEVWQRKELADHALLFFMLGTSLKSYFNTNLQMVETIAQQGTLDNSRVIVFMQSSQLAGSMFEVRYDSGMSKVLREHIADYSLPMIYDEPMAYSILNDLFKAAPAKEYGLYVGSHGKGWIPKADTSTSALSTFDIAEELIWTPAPGAAMVRHIGDAAATQLNTTEFASAIARTGHHLDYIIFDVCYMANVETAYDLKDVTDYILGSPCEVMASGMPYNDIITTMVSSQPLLTRLEGSAKAFVDYYKVNKTGIYSSACSAVINCAELEALAATVKATNLATQDVDPDTLQVYDGISNLRNPTHIFFDLEDYIIKSCTDASAVAAFSEQLARTVTGQHHTETFYSAYNNLANPIDYYSGITTSAPIMIVPGSVYRAKWKETEWYKATH